MVATAVVIVVTTLHYYREEGIILCLLVISVNHSLSILEGPRSQTVR